MNFGFSYVGLIYLLMLFIPNILWSKNKPKDYEKYVVNENKILLMFERIGEVLVSCFVLIFSDFNINEITLWSLWLFVSFVFMILYEIYWVRYFKKSKIIKGFLQQPVRHSCCRRNTTGSCIFVIGHIRKEHLFNYFGNNFGDRSYRDSYKSL